MCECPFLATAIEDDCKTGREGSCLPSCLSLGASFFQVNESAQAMSQEPGAQAAGPGLSQLSAGSPKFLGKAQIPRGERAPQSPQQRCSGSGSPQGGSREQSELSTGEKTGTTPGWGGWWVEQLGAAPWEAPGWEPEAD